MKRISVDIGGFEGLDDNRNEFILGQRLVVVRIVRREIGLAETALQLLDGERAVMIRVERREGRFRSGSRFLQVERGQQSLLVREVLVEGADAVP